MKGWCQLALKVFLYTCGAVVGGLCVAFGIGLLTALTASAVWLLIDSQLLDIEDPRVFQFTALVILGTIYGTGLSWSHLRYRIAGQYDSTDVAQNSPI